MARDTLPKWASVRRWCAITGISRTRTYALARDNKLILKRLGGSTYVDVEHGLAYLQSLPTYRDVPPSFWAGETNPPTSRKKK
jgi:hypothetical protein